MPATKVPYNNIVEFLTDSWQPALILPKTPEAKAPVHVYYSHLRELFKNLATREPFRSLRSGDRLSFLLPNSLEFVVVFLATLSLRGVAAPLNPAYTAGEVQFFVQDAKSRCILIAKDAPNKAELLALSNKLGKSLFEVGVQVLKDKRVERRVIAVNLVPGSVPWKPETHWRNHQYHPADVALFLHTSGTTGRPKGVPLTHRNILTTLKNIKETYELKSADVTYLVMPLFHVHGLIGALLSTLYAKGSVVLPPKFSVHRFWSDFNEYGCTWYSAVPTIHQMLLLKAKETYPGNSGELRAPSTLLDLEIAFGAPVIEAYAMTEAAHQMTSNYLPPGMRCPGSVGQGRNVDVRIMDEKGQVLPTRAVGEVCVRGQNVTSGTLVNEWHLLRSISDSGLGYHNNPKATKDSFHVDSDNPRGLKWLRTGDLGYFDENQFLFLVGRIKEQINRGGEKISPLEIDQVLLDVPGVHLAVAFPVKSQVYGQEIEAAIVPKEGAKVTTAELKAHCEKHLAPFKIPRRFHIVADVPKTATGKIQRANVAAHFEAIGPKL